ncbi:MAG TPA: MFS transporter, partial [Acidimicrobiales bacterium]|nr:MFS transporter [Acidimicrobiales bacterium]
IDRQTPDEEGGAGRARVRRLALAHGISVAGSQAAQIAVVYAIYARTRSGGWVVVTLAASISIGGLLAPVGGWVADHFDRRRLMMASELTAGAVYGAMAFAHAPLLLVTGALAATVAGTPFRAASAAAVPNLVGPTDLAWANGRLGAAFNLALVAGPIVGGSLVAAAGAGAVFAVNAGSYAASAVMIRSVRVRFQEARVGHARGPTAGDLLAGFSAVVTSRRLAPLAAANALAFAAFGAALVIDPALASQFHAGSVGYGLLTSTWGAGAVVGSVAAGRHVNPGRAPWAMTGGVALMALSLGSIAALPSFAAIVVVGTVGGFGSGFTFVPWLVLIQNEIVDRLRGRVVAASEALNQVLFLAGMGMAVPAVSMAGAHRAYALTGVLLTVAALAGAASLRPAPRRTPATRPLPAVTAEAVPVPPTARPGGT